MEILPAIKSKTKYYVWFSWNGFAAAEEFQAGTFPVLCHQASATWPISRLCKKTNILGKYYDKFCMNMKHLIRRLVFAGFCKITIYQDQFPLSLGDSKSFGHLIFQLTISPDNFPVLYPTWKASNTCKSNCKKKKIVLKHDFYIRSFGNNGQ